MRVGQKVKWFDPAIDDYPIEERETQLNRVYTIVEVINDEMCVIADEYGESEVFTEEIEPLPKTSKFIMEEGVLLCDEKVFGDNEEHSFNCKCYNGYAKCTATDSEEKIQKVTITYPLRKDVLKSEEMSNAVLEYRGLYDCTKKDIHYGDIMLTYGTITKTGE